MHKKRHLLMQVGGHVELHENPWQALAHELEEESGYSIAELSIIQPTQKQITLTDAILHPTPMLMNTHSVDIVEQGHFHSDLAYGFVVDHPPKKLPGEGESMDLRWLTLDELQAGVANGTVWAPVAEIYHAMVARYLPTYALINTNEFAV